MDHLSAQLIASGLNTVFLGRNLLYLPETTSTHAEAKRLARKGAPEGLLVVADHQTAGRGRLDRRWEAPAGSSLLLSIVFRPALEPSQIQQVTMSCGLAVVDALAGQTGLDVGLKWPNDIILAGAKLGGILTEIEFTGHRIEHMVVGIGLNVNLDPAQLSSALLWPATSLSQALGRHVPRLPLLWALLEAVEARYTALQAGPSPRAEWAERLATLGQAVVVSGAGVMLEGVAEGVDEDGALLVRVAGGGLERILVGDVSLRNAVDWHRPETSAIIRPAAEGDTGSRENGGKGRCGGLD